MIINHKRTRMVKDGEDGHGFNDELKEFREIFSSCGSREVGALNC